MSSYNIDSSASVICSGYGALELQDGSPWKPFSVQVYQPKTEHIDEASEFNTTFDVETDGMELDEISLISCRGTGHNF